MYSDCVVMSLEFVQLSGTPYLTFITFKDIYTTIQLHYSVWRKCLEIIHVLFYKQVMKFSICLDQWFILTNSVNIFGRME